MDDVPCSGDVIVRKDRHILSLWMPKTINALHKLQFCILVRDISLVKLRGIISYRTRSLNPMKDEVILAEALHMVASEDIGSCLWVKSDYKSKATVQIVYWLDGALVEGF